MAKFSKKLRIKWNFELTVFELTVPDLYLALILSIKELYSLWASCTVIKKTGFGMTDSNLNVISNVEDIEDAKTHLYSMKFMSQLRKSFWDS